MRRRDIGPNLVTTLLLIPLMALAGCGAGPTAGGAATSAVSPATVAATSTVLPPPLEGSRTLTNADNGRTVSLAVGERITLALTAAPGFDDWVVAVPIAAVLKPTVNPAAMAIRGVTLRAFIAVAPGQAAITATSRPTCAAGQACPALVQSFRVTIVVGG